MAYTGQTTESLKAELRLYEAFLEHDCSIENDEVKALIEEAWGSESDWTKTRMIDVLKNSSPAVIEYRIQANEEQLAMYENAKDGKKTAPPVYYDDEMTDEEEFEEQMESEFTPTFVEDW